jgi:hypothetical protein
VSTVDPSQRRAERFEGRLEFETLISDLSSRFIGLPAGEVDSEIEAEQRRVCGFLGVDRWPSPRARSVEFRLARPLSVDIVV